jgi:hypothetical protein
VIVNPAVIAIVGPGSQTADGTSIDVYSGSGAAASSLVTIAASLGTITTADADPNYAGIQVLTDAGGMFTFSVQRPNVPGTAQITAQQVNAASAGADFVDFRDDE